MRHKLQSIASMLADGCRTAALLILDLGDMLLESWGWEW